MVILRSQIQSDLQRAKEGYHVWYVMYQDWYVKYQMIRALLGGLCHNYPCLCLVFERITSINGGCKSIPFVASDDWNLNLCVGKQTKMKRRIMILMLQN
jgi:hypothetical protein